MLGHSLHTMTLKRLGIRIMIPAMAKGTSFKLIIFSEQIDFYLLYSQCIMAIIVS